MVRAVTPGHFHDTSSLPPCVQAMNVGKSEPASTDLIAMGCNQTKATKASVQPAQPPAGPGAPRAAVSQLTSDTDAAQARYHATTVLRSLLTHDNTLGGVPIKVLSARWLITFFQSAAGGTRLERRQVLESSHPQAFASAEMVERVLEEVEMHEFCGVKWKYLDDELHSIPIGALPSMASLSHMCAHAATLEAPRASACVAALSCAEPVCERVCYCGQVAGRGASRPGGPEHARALAACARVVLLPAGGEVSQLWGAHRCKEWRGAERRGDTGGG